MSDDQQRINDLTSDKINLRAENIELKAKLKEAMNWLDYYVGSGEINPSFVWFKFSVYKLMKD